MSYGSVVINLIEVAAISRIPLEGTGFESQSTNYCSIRFHGVSMHSNGVSLVVPDMTRTEDENLVGFCGLQNPAP